MKYKIHAIFAIVALASLPVSAAVAIVDLGTQVGGGSVVGANQSWTDAGRTYNTVVTIQRTTAGAMGSQNDLLDLTTNTSTGWNVAINKNNATGDTGAQAAVWTGSSSNAASPFTGESIYALGDGIYINNSAIVQVTFSNLTVGSFYNLAAFAALTGTSTPSNFSLTVGTSSSQAVQSLDIDTNQTSGLVANWLNVAPSASGTIAFTVQAGTATSGLRTELNAIRLEQVPEPSAFALLGLGAASLVARRRRS